MTLPAEWLEVLSPTEQEVAKTAARVFRRVKLWGACYHLTFFLNEYLKQEKGIDTQAVVGWVNDGTDDIMCSHAWLEINGKKTDIAIARPQYEENPEGALLILDRIIQPGKRKYTYHTERSHAAMRALDRIPYQAVQFAEIQHNEMVSISKDEKGRRRYLSEVPSHSNYRALIRLIS